VERAYAGANGGAIEAATAITAGGEGGDFQLRWVVEMLQRRHKCRSRIRFGLGDSPVMKAEFLEELRGFKKRLNALKRAVTSLTTSRVSKFAIRNEAEKLADFWIEKIRSPLEHKFKLDKQLISATAEYFKRLHQLSRPNNHKSSYLDCLNTILTDFDDRFNLPVQQSGGEPESVLQLHKLVPLLTDAHQSDYPKKAIECAEANHSKAAIVMGWCAAIDRIQQKVMALGLANFNKISTAVKNQTSGKYKRWSKEFKVTTEAELQAIFDTDLIVVVENMGLLDGNESERLEICFTYRNQSAHPGKAPVDSPHVVAFFTDIVKIVLANPKFAI
jgi:hypothetical protein